MVTTFTDLKAVVADQVMGVINSAAGVPSVQPDTELTLFHR